MQPAHPFDGATYHKYVIDLKFYLLVQITTMFPLYKSYLTVPT